MQDKRHLVVGATDHVGSKTAVLLADRRYDVTALVRRDRATIRGPDRGTIRYVTGDLSDVQRMIVDDYLDQNYVRPGL